MRLYNTCGLSKWRSRVGFADWGSRGNGCSNRCQDCWRKCTRQQSEADSLIVINLKQKQIKESFPISHNNTSNKLNKPIIVSGGIHTADIPSSFKQFLQFQLHILIEIVLLQVVNQTQCIDLACYLMPIVETTPFILHLFQILLLQDLVILFFYLLVVPDSQQQRVIHYILVLQQLYV